MDESPLVLPPSEKNVWEDKSLLPRVLLLEKQIEQSPRPCISDPMKVRERVLRGYKMIIKQGTKRFTLLRFLLAKMLYGEGGLSVEDYLCLYHLYFDLSEITESHFLLKNKVHLEKVNSVLSKLSDNRIFPLILSLESKEAVEQFLGRSLPNQREFFGLLGQRELSRSYRLVLNDSLVPHKLPPKAYIGVGYKDKGTRRNVSENGTPGWQEIGSHISNREREAEELDSSTSKSLKD